MLSEKLINASGAPTPNWDLTHATTDRSGIGRKYVTGQMSSVTDGTFSTDGTKMYLLSGTTIYQYSMLTAYDVGGANYDSKSKNLSSNFSTVNTFTFNVDGTKMYAASAASFAQYTLSTAWDISTATLMGSLIGFANDSSIKGICFKPDGTTLYVTGTSTDNVYQLNLTSSWDISSFTVAASFNFSSQSTFLEKTIFKTDGTKMYVMSVNFFGEPAFMYEYDLSTPWAISTATYNSVSLDYISDSNHRPFAFSNDGNYLFFSYNNTVHAKKLTGGAWSVSSGLSDVLHINGIPSKSYSTFNFSSDGNILYLAGTDNITRWNLSVPWDISTIGSSYTDIFYPGIASINIASIKISTDGTRFFFYNITNRRIYRYNLATPWLLSSGTNIESFLTDDTAGSTVEFSNDGTKFFFSGTSRSRITEYTLTTPWTLSSATSLRTFSIGGQGFCFNNDGSKIYTINRLNSRIDEYRLWKNWSFEGNATYKASFSVGGVIGYIQDIQFNSTGLGLYISDAQYGGPDIYLNRFELL